MNYSIVTTRKFDKDIKMYNKKFKNIADDVKEVVEELKKRKFSWRCNT